jgi:hypothetical protein
MRLVSGIATTTIGPCTRIGRELVMKSNLSTGRELSNKNQSSSRAVKTIKDDTSTVPDSSNLHLDDAASAPLRVLRSRAIFQTSEPQTHTAARGKSHTAKNANSSATTISSIAASNEAFEGKQSKNGDADRICTICGAEYSARKHLLRHISSKHPHVAAAHRARYPRVEYYTINNPNFLYPGSSTPYLIPIRSTYKEYHALVYGRARNAELREKRLREHALVSLISRELNVPIREAEKKHLHFSDKEIEEEMDRLGPSYTRVHTQLLVAFGRRIIHQPPSPEQWVYEPRFMNSGPEYVGRIPIEFSSPWALS